MESNVGTNSSGVESPNVGQQVVDEHLRNLRHFLPDERTAAWSEHRYAEARALHGRQRSIENERRQAEVSRSKKELKLRMNRQKVLIKEQIEREDKERRAQDRIAQLERQRLAERSAQYVANSIPPPPPLPLNTMPDLCVWYEQHNAAPVVYYDFARPGDARVVFKARPL